MVKRFCLSVFVIIIGVAFFSFVSADVISINSGGYENLIVDNNDVDVFFSSSESSNATIIVSPVCGNGVLESGEGCDDSNIVSGDGCSASCVIEVAAPVLGGGGGGGGGSVVSTDKITELVSTLDLSAVPESLNLPATVGIQTSAKLTLTNNGNNDLNLSFNVVSLEDMISFDEDSFILGAGEIKVLEFFIMPNESGIHTGKFVFSATEGILEVPVILNTNSELTLFDIKLDISEDMRVIFIGERVVSQISLIQMGLQSDVDVAMNYVIKDFSGRTYLTQTETIRVNKEKYYSHVFETGSLPPGDYIVGAEVIYAGGVATASSQFRVASEELFPWWILIIVMVAVLVIIVVAAKFYKKRK